MNLHPRSPPARPARLPTCGTSLQDGVLSAKELSNFVYRYLGSLLSCLIAGLVLAQELALPAGHESALLISKGVLAVCYWLKLVYALYPFK